MYHLFLRILIDYFIDYLFYLYFYFTYPVYLIDWHGSRLNYYQLNLPDPGTPIAFGIHSLHNYLIFFMCIILFSVVFLLCSTLYYFSFYKDKYYNIRYYIFWIYNHMIVSPLFIIVSFFCYYFIPFVLHFPIFSVINIYLIKFRNFFLFFLFNRWVQSNSQLDLLCFSDCSIFYISRIIGNESFRHWINHCSLFDQSKIFYIEENLSDSFRINWLNYLVTKNQYKVTHNISLEVIWTIIPTLILIIIAMPSFSLLYSMDELLEPSLTIKIIGHQWYWSYEYSDFQPLTGNSITFDSYMLPDSDLDFGDLRLLKTDCPLILPKETNIRFLITSSDVLHSWAIPSFGIKMDAIPGRLNQTSAYIVESGRYYGQCSELCGVNHGFMPIEICVLEPLDYYNWLLLKIKEV